jgi:hypothetical protein
MIHVSDTGAAIAALKEVARGDRLGEFAILYGITGGLPPPLSPVRQITLYSRDGRDTAEFERARYDKRFTPADLSEVWRLAAPRGVARALAQQILDASVFEKTFAEETRPNVHDMLIYEILVHRAKGDVEKRFYKSVPPGLETLRASFEGLMERVRREGERTLYHGADVVADPPGGIADAKK